MDTRRRFDAGPIRPPAHSHSLLLRVTRGCSWGRCTFCVAHKQQPFQRRSPAEIIADIETLAGLASTIRRLAAKYGADGAITDAVIRELLTSGYQREAVQVAFFLQAGGKNAFLQDTDALSLPTGQLVEVLQALRAAFPSLEAVTTYAHPATLAEIERAQLRQLRAAGLTEVQLGLDSGSQQVLELADKGASAAQHAAAAVAVKGADLRLVAFVVPGLGGALLSHEHVYHTARLLRRAQPHVVRLRTLTVPDRSLLAAQRRAGRFEDLDEIGCVREIRELLCQLHGVNCRLESRHLLNLLHVEGQLPADLPRLLGVIDRFLGFRRAEQQLFIQGRRLGLLRTLDDLDDAGARHRAKQVIDELSHHLRRPADAARQVLTRHL